ncbi:hypothetical protein FACS1894159_05000 [Bacteroidia bacterium]|nr:hypothetical protein FACS1894159_05000 [Bacteroidia bacterium]
MKKLVKSLTALALTAIVAVSCSKDEVNFDQSLLIGKWETTTDVSIGAKSGKFYCRFDQGGTGVTWFPADDITEAEGSPFTWTLSKNQLDEYFQQENLGAPALTLTIATTTRAGAQVYEGYTITELTASSLKYTDNVDKAKKWAFSKL